MAQKKSSKAAKPATAGRLTRKKRRTAAASTDATDSDAFPIVGIGASAGGFDALRRLLESMSNDPGLALVIIQHLDPTKKSLASELLAKQTELQVVEVDDEPLVQRNCVYVIPPGKYLSISGGRLHLSDPDKPRGARMAIDFFLRSLAKDQQHRAVAVIVSGTGTDGTLGIKSVKTAGGLVIVQDPYTAEHDGMPRSAIATGIVDHVLAVDKIPAVLARYAQSSYIREPLGSTPTVEAEVPTERPPDGLGDILEIMRRHTKHDYRNYKERTLIRRTRRRMCLHHIDDYDTYVKYMQQHPKEIDALAKDLLISVTDFFREPEAWEELRKSAIRPIVAAKADDEPIRVWTPGCATGEEPYSMAMLIREELQRSRKSCPVQVFASDIDIDALEYGRVGRYPKSIESDVSAKRLKQFFSMVDGDDYYQVNKALRESVVFANQSLIADPPFSKLDLLCCRNLLIYLKPEVQEKLIALFHFALCDGGVLFLGSAETIGRQDHLFRTLHKRWRIFCRVGPTRHELVDIPVARTDRRPVETLAKPSERAEARLSHLAQQRLLDLLAPSAVLINPDWRILYICGDIDPYLTHKAGRLSDDLLEKARQGLASKLRGAVHTAISENRTISATARLRRNSSYYPISITVRVVHDSQTDEPLALVLFEECQGEPGDAKQLEHAEQETDSARKRGTGPAKQRGRASKVGADDGSVNDGAVIRQLEDELSDTKHDLQSAVEQLESSNEEYRASNEEVMSVNEELQSTNEELETSKEELQSLNEELSTVNGQLAGKVEELETKHSDLQNLLAVTNIATIFLDTDLMVRLFTPAAQSMIRLKPADAGRALADLSHDFARDDLVEVAQRVLADLATVEDEVHCHDGRTFLRRVTPYRTEDHRIGGIVVTFVDITRRKQDEQALRGSQAQLARELTAMTRLQELVGRLLVSSDLHSALNEVLDAALTLMDTNMGTVQLVDPQHATLEIHAQHGFREEFLGYFHTVTSNDTSASGRAMKESRRIVIEDVQTDPLYAPHRTMADVAGYRAVQSTPLVSRGGTLLGMLSTHFQEPRRPLESDLRLLDIYARQAADVVDAVRSRQALHESEERLRLATKGAQIGTWDWDLQSDQVAWSEIECELLGRDPALSCSDVQEFFDCVHPNDIQSLRREVEKAIEKDATYVHEFRVILSDGQMRWLAGKGEVHRDQMGNPVRMMGVNYDISDRKSLEVELHELNESLEQQVSQRTRMLSILQDVTRSANEAHTINEAMHAALERIAQYNGWKVGHVWRLAEDGECEMVDSGIWYITDEAEKAIARLDEFQQICEKLRFSWGQPVVGVVAQSGRPMWIDDIAGFPDWRRGDSRHLGLHAAIAFPVTVNDEVVAVVEFFSDHPASREQRFMEIMPDVGIQLGHVIERKRLEKRIADAAEREQRRIGRDIHDGIGQELTGLRHLAHTHAESLAEQQSPEAKIAQRINTGLRTAQEQLRSVIRELIPVEVSEKGLVEAVRALAGRVSEFQDLPCTLECDDSVVVEDTLVATHIYRIVQEAVGNAVAHADARHIVIHLDEREGELHLRVADDGVGIGLEPVDAGGFGMRSMAHRADLIGGRLTIGAGDDGGTVIYCSVPLGPFRKGKAES